MNPNVILCKYNIDNFVQDNNEFLSPFCFIKVSKQGFQRAISFGYYGRLIYLVLQMSLFILGSNNQVNILKTFLNLCFIQAVHKSRICSPNVFLVLTPIY